MQLILFFILWGVCSVIGYGSQRCSWGPSYWCSNLKKSVECSATTHCIAQNWIHKVYPEDDDDVCTICKNMVKEARDTLLSDETQTELKEVFEGSCKLIPVSIISKECMDLVDEFIPYLIETLSSEMNPQSVCAVAGLCNSRKIDKFLKDYDNNNYSLTCKKCKSETRKFIKTLRKTDKNIIEDNFLIGCDMFSSYSDACRMTIISNFEDIYRYLSHTLNDEICDLAGLCSKGFTVDISENDLPCEFCEKVIQHWKDVWTSNVTESEFKLVLEQLCHKLSGSRVERCLHVVDDYYIPWFNYILHNLNPHTVCQMMSICTSTEIAKELSIFTIFDDEMESFPAISLLPTQKIDLPAVSSSIPTLEIQDNKCLFCEYAITTLEEYITNKEDEKQILSALHSLCERLPHQYIRQCEFLVDKYTDQIIHLIMNQYTPEQLCKKLKLCNDVRNSEADVLCLYGIHVLYATIDNVHNENKVNSALNDLCSRLPSSVFEKCQSVLESYRSDILSMINYDETPSKICSYLQKSEDKRWIFNDLHTSCKNCQNAIQNVNKNKLTIETIDEIVTNICNHSLILYSIPCEEIDLQQILYMIQEDWSSDDVCKELSQCHPPIMGSIYHPNDIPSLENSLENEYVYTKPYCILCKVFMDFIESKILTNRTIDMTVHGVEFVCSYFPDSLADICYDFVEKYGDVIIKEMKVYSVGEICSVVKACDDDGAQHLEVEIGNSPLVLLGGKRCSWGSTYWCASKENAIACGRTEYCELVGWN